MTDDVRSMAWAVLPVLAIGVTVHALFWAWIRGKNILPRQKAPRQDRSKEKSK